jgi:hypothetical protein
LQFFIVNQTIDLENNPIEAIWWEKKVYAFFVIYNFLMWNYSCDICFRRNKDLISELSIPAPDSENLHFPSKYSIPFLTQCKACLWKQHWSYWRNAQHNGLRFLFTIVSSVFLGCMYFGIGSKM